MTITRTLTGLAVAAALTMITPAIAQAATGTPDVITAGSTAKWGAHYAPGKRAKALGSLTAADEDHAVIPAATVKISGKVHDLTRATATCGWAVFRITYRDDSGNLPFKHHSVRDCTYHTPKSFSFRHRDVYQVELKVCSEGKATKPSLTCLYAGTWKTLYLSR